MLTVADSTLPTSKTPFAPALTLLAVVYASVATPLAAENAPPPPMVWTTSLQTGFADTFQLTLGGTFGEGPAWQNRVTTGLANVFRAGDSLSVYGADSLDTPSHVNNWQAGIGYKALVLKRRNHSLAIGSGLQHWRFPAVKTGTHDWLIPGSSVYQTRVYRFPFTVTNDSWTILSSPLPVGSLLHTQVWLQHNLFRREHLKVAFRHGPAHTYSWGFWGTNGNRVLRYQTMLAVTYKDLLIEGGYRKQWGLEPGIHNNAYWQFALTRTFAASFSR